MDETGNKKVKLFIIIGCIVVALLAIVVIATSGEKQPVQNNVGNNSNNNSISGGNEPVGDNEKELSIQEADKYFEMIPFMYEEEFAPFSDKFLLTAAMVAVGREMEPDYTASHVDEIVKELFGNDVKINKENVKEIDVAKSIYYYYPETDSYAILPVGMESIYMNQLLKKVTHKGEYIYVYTYEINGTWHEEEDKVVVVIGDKNGNDLVKSFENFESTQDFGIWQKEHANELPVLRYTLKKLEDRYILVGVEKVNY